MGRTPVPKEMQEMGMVSMSCCIPIYMYEKKQNSGISWRKIIEHGLKDLEKKMGD